MHDGSVVVGHQVVGVALGQDGEDAGEFAAMPQVLRVHDRVIVPVRALVLVPEADGVADLVRGHSYLRQDRRSY